MNMSVVSKGDLRFLNEFAAYCQMIPTLVSVVPLRKCCMLDILELHLGPLIFIIISEFYLA